MHLTKALVFLLILLNTGTALAQWGRNKDWMDVIDESCNTTFKGKAKRLFGELEFWAHVNSGMEMWIEDMRSADYVGYCRASHSPPDQREELMRCLASVKRDIDWFNRCKPTTVMLCRQAGGRC